MNENPYLPIKTEVLDVIDESSTIKTFRLKPAMPLHFKAGQFVAMTVPGIGEAPFTPSSSPYEQDELEITIMKAGKITTLIHQLKKGDVVGLRGPYGNEYALDDYKGKDVLLVGGGVGLAPLRALFLALVHNLENYKSIVFCCGSRTPSDIIYKESILKKWQEIDKKKVKFRITVDKKDDSWKGNVGLVTTALDKLDLNIDNSVSIVCGPPIMMKFATFKLLEIGYMPEQIYLSMEKNMSCGIGKCGHCRIGNYYACKDGPVFRYDKISNLHELWD